MLGQRGVNLLEKIVLEMGFVWTATGQLEAGIDGLIETRDAKTQQAFNCVIQVQSKAVSELPRETQSGFEFICKPNDLDYWLRGNAPVILVISRPDKGDAFWISIKDYFSDLSKRKDRKVLFDKKKNSLTRNSREALLKLAAPIDSGLYLSPLPKEETLWSNLILVRHIGPEIHIADTSFRFRWQVSNQLRKLSGFPGTEWELWNEKLISFHDLSEASWSGTCDQGTSECFSLQDWKKSYKSKGESVLRSLMHRALKRLLSHRGVAYHDRREFFFFRASQDLTPIRYQYRSFVKRAERAVFQPYPRHLEPGRYPSYYRHCACTAKFLGVEGCYYLELNPTYYFTSNGVATYRFHEERLKGIKRLEKNAAIVGQVVMWSELLTQEPVLFEPEYPFLKFGPLQSFRLSRGINDETWLPKDDEKGAQLRKEIEQEHTLFIP